MPGFWEGALGINAGGGDYNRALSSTGGGGNSARTVLPAGTAAGYTNLEDYLHFLATPHVTASKNTAADPTSIDVDLSKYTSGFTKTPVFTLSNVTGGAATLLPDGHTVHFVPTANTFG